jgi:hypothetical protein
MIPTQVETYDEILPRLRPAYGRSALGWIEVNQVGAAIGAYRSALEKDPHQEPVAPRRKMTRKEWSTLLSVVGPEERGYFMRAFVAKRITLKD